MRMKKNFVDEHNIPKTLTCFLASKAFTSMLLPNPKLQIVELEEVILHGTLNTLQMKNFVERTTIYRTYCLTHINICF